MAANVRRTGAMDASLGTKLTRLVAARFGPQLPWGLD